MKKITRSIEVVEYEVTLFDAEKETLEKANYTDFESLRENDIVRFMNASFADSNDPRRVVKIKPLHASSGLYEMPIDVFLQHATRVEK